MPHIPLELRSMPFSTERGVPVPATRFFVRANFFSSLGQRIPYPTFIDTGAAYSVIPYRLARQLRWATLGAYLISGRKSASIEWLGIPCEMGELELELIDTQAFVRTGALRVVAKVASRPATLHLDAFAVLGLNFLRDNQALLELDARTPAFLGSLWVP